MEQIVFKTQGSDMMHHSQPNGFLHHPKHPDLPCNRSHDIIRVTSHLAKLKKNLREMEICIQGKRFESLKLNISERTENDFIGSNLSVKALCVR